MPTPISALDHHPRDLVREVSPDAISFYVDDLSGLYLPDSFKEEHANLFDVKYWEPERRLSGKFGRYALRLAQEDEERLDDILVMGTTIGLSGLDYEGRHMKSLRHHMLDDGMRNVFAARDLLDKKVAVKQADFGSTYIKLGDDGTIETVEVSNSSYDFGRAAAEGRQVTCEMFARLLGDEIQVVNADPEPIEREKIIPKPFE